MCRDIVRRLPIGLSLVPRFCYAPSHAEVQATVWVISFYSVLPTCSVGIAHDPWTGCAQIRGQCQLCSDSTLLLWSMSMGLNLVCCYVAEHKLLGRFVECFPPAGQVTTRGIVARSRSETNNVVSAAMWKVVAAYTQKYW